MYEDEKNTFESKETSGSTPTVDLGQWAANNKSDNASAGQNTNTYRNYNYSGSNPYTSQGSSYNQSAAGTGYTNQNTSYSNPGTAYNGQTSYNGGYSYGQNNYSYNQARGTQPTYGNYQYATNPATPPRKKKNVLARVIAAIVALSLVTGGAYYGYTTVGKQLIGKNDAAVTEDSEKEDQSIAQATDNSQASEDRDTQIKTTTVSGDAKTVVTDVTGVVAEVMPAMVMIHNNYTQSANYFGYIMSQEAQASGSGIIVGKSDSELLIATNYHVIEGADTLEVIFTDDSTQEAVVKGTNSDMDLAVIAVMLDGMSNETLDTIKIATLGDSDSLTLGEPAIAIGNALGYGQSVTTGVISALNRTLQQDGVDEANTFIQTDAAINPGNSGGALLNTRGEVIGINSNKIGGDTVEGMGYAIPISVAKPIIEKLMNEKAKIKVASAERGYVGISGVSVTTEVSQGYGIPQGVYVAEVSEGGGAQAAGIEKGDVIVGFDGNEVTSMEDLQTKLQYYAAGTSVDVVVMRQGHDGEYEELTYNVTLGYAAGSTDTNAAEDGSKGGFNGSAPENPGEGGQESQSGGH